MNSLFRWVHRTTCCISILFLCMNQVSKAQTCTLMFDSTEVTYIVHLPKGYVNTRTYPLVVNFHGLGSKATKHQKYCKMDKVADKEGFIVVYPQSYHIGWNAGLGFVSYTHGVDDIAFLNAMLDTLESTYSIDETRIYTAGVSLGGTFNYRIACEMSNRIAAIASVSGLMSDSTYANCDTKRTIPILHIHGTSDHIMKYNGMEQANGAEDGVKLWAYRNQCEKPDTIEIPNRKKTDFSKVLFIRYSNCANGSQVWFYKIKHGGHTWPGGAEIFKLMGRRNQDINGSQAIWDFFKQFTLNTGMNLQSKQ